ncbi:MAG: nitroreductase family protein [Patulibacter sp.]|nr:nitroreductase family protein [Patulibacter sp.]
MPPAVRTDDRPDARLLAPIRDRWSPRAFDATHGLTDDHLALILDAARWAASAGNSQPWAFLVGLRGDPTFTAFHARLSRGNTAWAGRASALLITLHQVAIDPDSDLPFSDYAAYDLGQAAASLSLQAQAMGLHTHQFAGFDHEAVAEHFAVPPHWRVTTGIAIGQLAPASSLEPALAVRERRPRVRKDASEFVFAERFGEPAPRI